MSKKFKENLLKIGLFLGIAVVVVWVIFPIFWAGITAFKNPVDVNAYPPKVFFKPTLINWQTINQDWHIGQFFKSSLIVSIASTILAVIVGSLAAYSFSRFKIRGRQGIALDILTIRMIPPIVSAVPIFIIARQTGLYNSYWLLIILYTTFNFPLVVWLMKSFIDEIPEALEEAGMVDGCSRFQSFIRIVLPLCTPGLFANIILVFIFVWNEFLFASIMVQGDQRTLPTMVALSIKQRAILWGPASMSALVVVVPVIILSLMVQRYIVSGLTFGALKE